MAKNNENKKISNGVSAKFSKYYSRKVSLKGITSQYDNIECGTSMTLIANFKNKEELSKILDMMSKKVFHESENDIIDAVSNLSEVKKNNPQSANLGLGTNLDTEKYLEEQIGPLEELIAGSESVEKTLDITESSEDIDFLGD